MPVDISSSRAIGGTRPGGYVVPGSMGVTYGDASTIYGLREPGSRRDLPGTAWTDWDRYGSEHNGLRTYPHHPSIFSMDPAELEGGGDHPHDQPCDVQCEKAEFTCSKSCACIHASLHCDGVANCAHKEDEEDCEKVIVAREKQIKDECEATGQHILCPNTEVCISKDFLCDGDDDCLDYSDETRCGVGATANCSQDQFECNNGLCILKQWYCDGDNDCIDYSDEMNCTRK
jgi:Low-density lipoprotein receptor domain class A